MSRNPERRDRARELRREMTPAERILWRQLRGKRFADLKFRRQYPFGRFWADFACCCCKVALETDGESHLATKERDDRRTQFFERHGWKVLRLWNTEVFDELEAVLELIYRTCMERLEEMEKNKSKK